MKNLCFYFGGGMNFGCTHYVLIKFPMGSQSVPQHVPNSSSLYLVSFALSSTLGTNIGKAQRKRDFMLDLQWKVDQPGGWVLTPSRFSPHNVECKKDEG
jgi:hypothetical protein